MDEGQTRLARVSNAGDTVYLGLRLGESESFRGTDDAAGHFTTPISTQTHIDPPLEGGASSLDQLAWQSRLARLCVVE